MNQPLRPEAGDIQVDPDGSEWVIIAVYGRDLCTRIRRDSLAHHVFAKDLPVFAKSLS